MVQAAKDTIIGTVKERLRFQCARRQPPSQMAGTIKTPPVFTRHAAAPTQPMNHHQRGLSRYLSSRKKTATTSRARTISAIGRSAQYTSQGLRARKPTMSAPFHGANPAERNRANATAKNATVSSH